VPVNKCYEEFGRNKRRGPDPPIFFFPELWSIEYFYYM